MHDQGVLEMARGALSARDEILGTPAKNASTPEALRAIRNLLFLQRVLGCIEPDQFQAIFEAIPEGLHQATAHRKEHIMLFGLLRRLTSQESLRALAAAVDFLQCFGGRLLLVQDTANAQSVPSKEISRRQIAGSSRLQEFFRKAKRLLEASRVRTANAAHWKRLVEPDEERVS